MEFNMNEDIEELKFCVIALQRRSETLEKANRRFRFVFGCAIACSLLLLLSALSNPDLSVVRARRFELVGDDGTLLAALLPTEAGTILAMYDLNGKPRLRLDASKVSGLWIKDDSGSDRITLANLATGPRLSFRNSAGVGQAELGLYVWGPGLHLYDQQGLNRFAASVSMKSPATLQQEPILQLKDEKGSTTAVLGAFTDGPQLSLRNSKGVDRAQLALNGVGQPWLHLNDAWGVTRVTLSAFTGWSKPSDGGPSLLLMDSNGLERANLMTTNAESKLLMKDAQGATTHSFPP
jgi:hypothetical protein